MSWHSRLIIQLDILQSPYGLKMGVAELTDEARGYRDITKLEVMN
jgi:hypothetical protein